MSVNPLLAKAKLLQQSRTLEAKRKRLHGPAGKLASIARWLGRPIYDDGPMDFDPDLVPREGMSVDDLPLGGRLIGHHYSGLSWGKNFEVESRTDVGTTVAHWQREIVYREVDGELTHYVPGDDWERDVVDRLGDRVDEARKRKSADQPPRKEAAAAFLKQLKERWGI